MKRLIPLLILVLLSCEFESEEKNFFYINQIKYKITSSDASTYNERLNVRIISNEIKDDLVEILLNESEGYKDVRVFKWNRSRFIPVDQKTPFKINSKDGSSIKGEFNFTIYAQSEPMHFYGKFDVSKSY